MIRQRKRSPLQEDPMLRDQRQRVAVRSTSVILVLKVVRIESTILIVARKRNNNDRVLLSITGCHPFMYYRDEDSSIVDPNILKKRFLERFSKTIIWRHCLPDMHVIQAKPLKGYQKHTSPFLQLTFKSEEHRISIARFIARKGVCNLYESDITMRERFVTDTGIVPGKMLRLDGTILKHGNDSSVSYKTMCDPTLVQFVDTAEPPINYIISNFWLLQEGIDADDDDGTYSVPVAWNNDKELRKQKFTKHNQKENPIAMCVMQLYDASDQSTRHFLFHDGSFRIPEHQFENGARRDCKVIGFLGYNKQDREKKMR